eukprot:11137634-Alexandrium_andersonii.AAC.1
MAARSATCEERCARTTGSTPRQPATPAQAWRMARISSLVTILARHAASTTRGIASKTAISAPCPMPKMNRG